MGPDKLHGRSYNINAFFKMAHYLVGIVAIIGLKTFESKCDFNAVGLKCHR